MRRSRCCHNSATQRPAGQFINRKEPRASARSLNGGAQAASSCPLRWQRITDTENRPLRRRRLRTNRAPACNDWERAMLKKKSDGIRECLLHAEEMDMCLELLLPAFLRCLIHCSRHFLRLCFGALEAIMAFGAILIEPDDLPPDRADLRTPRVSRRSEFSFCGSRLFRHYLNPRAASRGA
jgi:hypothetical protein